MKYLLIFIVFITLSSCGDQRLQKYKTIIQEADRFEIYSEASHTNVIISNKNINYFKEILVRDVKPEMSHEFVFDVSISIYKGNQKTAILLISNVGNRPLANFKSEETNFGFQLTYGIGQYVGNIDESTIR